MYLRLIVRLSCRVYLCVFFVLFSVYLYALYLLLQYGKLLAVTGHLSTHTTVKQRWPVDFLPQPSPALPAASDFCLPSATHRHPSIAPLQITVVPGASPAAIMQNASTNTDNGKAALKTGRANAKRLVTKQINGIRTMFVSDISQISLSNEISKFMTLFESFEQACEQYEQSLDVDDEEEIDKCDDYFRKGQENFCKVMEQYKSHQQSHDIPDRDISKNADPSCDLARVVSSINLNNVDIPTFNGNPLKYHQFIRSFDLNIDAMCLDDNLKLTRLVHYCSGSAKASIEGCMLLGTTGYCEARKILQSRFGNPNMISERIVSNLRDGKQARSHEELLSLADEVKNAKLILGELNMLHEVSSQSVMLTIIRRTPKYVQNNWGKRGLKIKKNSGAYPKFDDLVDFITDVAQNAADPVFGQHYMRGDRPEAKVNLTTHNAAAINASPLERVVPDSTHATSPVLPSTNRSGAYAKPEFPCVLCTQRHRLWHCNDFKAMTVTQRIDLVERYSLCHNCLLPSHNTASCGKKSVCSVKNCGKKHTMYLHVDNVKPAQSKNPTGDQINAASLGTYVNNACYMPIVKVKVNDSVYAHALLDTASTNSFCTQALADKLSVQGKVTRLNLSTLGNTCSTESECISLSVSSLDNDCTVEMSGLYVVGNIPAVTTPIDISRYKHLQNLSFPSYNDSQSVDMLIGQDNSEVLLPLDIRKGDVGEPFATRSCLGWCLNGRTPVAQVSNSVINNFIQTTDFASDAKTVENVHKLWNMENEGLEGLGHSREDQDVLRLWDTNCKKDGLHYELPIPWKDPEVSFPNNYIVAKSSMDSLVKKLKRDNLFDRYEQEIDKLLDKEYAENVPQDALHCNSGKIWYLPHHSVITAKKPGKLRVVYDCASKFKGMSLNDRCMQGPDLVNKLLFVLLRFRLHAFAIQADIEAMYNQVRVPVHDRDALRFLWFRDGKIVHYRMTTHLFEGVWCASSSAYALRRTVHDFDSATPLIRNTIEQSMYVDDCLKSVPSKSEALQVISETKQVLKSGGFNLTKFIANDESLLAEVPIEDRAIDVNDITPESAGKVLGIKWNILQDEFYFDVNQTTIPLYSVSLRMILSTVSSIYDPLGFIGPLILPGKLVFQEATRQKLSWDECVPQNLEFLWKTWVNGLGDINLLKIPRCVKPRDFDQDAVVELHHFSDASLQAYGACSYLRCINKNGKINTQLLISKNKVAPINQSTVPRLELQAAVIAAKLDDMLKRELDIEVDQSYFWTDSQIVLGYITNVTRRFHIFVENRVSKIRQLTNENSWNHVRSNENPADLLTRSKSMTVNQLDKFWFEGPPWLTMYKCEWPEKPIAFKVDVNDPEVKSAAVMLNVPQACAYQPTRDNEMKIDPVYQICQHFSNWSKMKRALAWLLRFVKCLKYKDFQSKPPYLTAAEVKHAQTVLIKTAQAFGYPEEVHKLSQKKDVKKSSSLTSLKPYLDVDGLICVGGRIHNQHPYIIPSDHPIAKAIILHFHNLAHVGLEWTLSLIRQNFWIVKARRLVKKIIQGCVVCKRLYAKPSSQLMADLPSERIEPNTPAFTNIGVDIFGPYTIKNYRSEIKRYGCIFTCLASRAVHIEKLNSLDMDSFVNGFRRFIARRGVPAKVYSDNGTNIVSGEKEMRLAFRDLIQSSAFQGYLATRHIEWSFIPPASPHMGGVWERLVGLIKRVLVTVLKESRRLNDEVLETVFCEIESIANGRPLTKLSDDPSDVTPLTPNHLLLLKQGAVLPPGRFNPNDIFRRRWRQVQSIADQFWHKWVQLYLPELQKRVKWRDKNRNISVGDLVMVMDENTPRHVWPLALVKGVNTSHDGLVRSVQVRTRTSDLVRPITKLVLLEADAEIEADT